MMILMYDIVKVIEEHHTSILSFKVFKTALTLTHIFPTKCINEDLDFYCLLMVKIYMAMDACFIVTLLYCISLLKDSNGT